MRSAGGGSPTASVLVAAELVLVQIPELVVALDPMSGLTRWAGPVSSPIREAVALP